MFFFVGETSTCIGKSEFDLKFIFSLMFFWLIPRLHEEADIKHKSHKAHVELAF